MKYDIRCVLIEMNVPLGTFDRGRRCQDNYLVAPSFALCYQKPNVVETMTALVWLHN